MKKYFVLFLVLFAISCSDDKSENPESPIVAELRGESQKAYNYLNKVRANPSAYSAEMCVDLSYVKSKPALNWNPLLQKAAERKAQDMADRNYFAHVDPAGYGMNFYINKAGYTLIPDFLKENKTNNFESIAAGVKSGEEIIRLLIEDKGYEDNPGHRNHLLGIKDFWANCYDIGIGIAYNPKSEYRYYCSVLIAKHEF
ncbi:MAG: CAP domain-containing protein [Chloroflexota bacterium]